MTDITSSILFDSQARPTLRFVQQQVKGLVDRSLGLVLVIFFSPVLLFTAVVVRLGLGRPILFRQPRVGKDGRIFTILKFRTLNVACDAQGRPLPDCQRMPKLGHFLRRAKLDELPQLFHLVLGDMSLIGPRPLMLLPEDPALVDPSIHYARATGGGALEHIRRQFKPGISGLTQVNGNTRFSLQERMVLDAYYIRNFYLAWDLLILMKTVLVLVLGERVNRAALAEAYKILPSAWTVQEDLAQFPTHPV